MDQTKTRSVILIVCATLSFAITVVGMVTLLRAANVESGLTGIGVGVILELHAQNLVTTQQFPGERIVVLGDSTVVDYPYLQAVPDNLRRLLRGRAPAKTLVIPIAAPGMSAPEYYAFADLIADNGADQVVFPINLVSFSDRWRTGFNRREAIGWIPIRRIPDLMTRPFHALNLTLDRILFYMGIVHFDLVQNWQNLEKERVRAINGVQHIRRELQTQNPRIPKDGLPKFRLPFFRGNTSRSNRHYAEALYGGAIEGISPNHPVTQMLAGALEIYERAGVRVLAYVVPMNVEHFDALGLETKSITPKTIKMLRNLVERRGGTFLDLHRLFPDKAFKDLGGHFLQEDGFDGAMLLARQLAPDLLRGYSRPEPTPARRVR